MSYMWTICHIGEQWVVSVHRGAYAASAAQQGSIAVLWRALRTLPSSGLCKTLSLYENGFARLVCVCVCVSFTRTHCTHTQKKYIIWCVYIHTQQGVYCVQNTTIGRVKKELQEINFIELCVPYGFVVKRLCLFVGLSILTDVAFDLAFAACWVYHR